MSAWPIEIATDDGSAFASSMLRYGCTRLEIGVQSVYEDVARDTNRGHTVQATCESFHMGKDAGFKIVSHMMVSNQDMLDCTQIFDFSCSLSPSLSLTFPMSESNETWNNSTSTLKTLRSARMDSRSIQPWSFEGPVCTSCGELDATKTTRPTRSSTSWLESWP